MLQIIAAGTGRDGTVSLTHFINQLFQEESKGRTVCHEYSSRECYNHYADFCLTGNRQELEEIIKLFVHCPYQAIVGNGYAFLLPHLRKVLPRDLRFIHLQRRDRKACIDSFINLTHFFPQTSANYSPRTDVDFLVQRTAAFHLGEMSQTDWDKLPLSEKYGWYYDKTHALLDEATNWFDHTLHVYTEDLNSEQTLQSIADFLGIKATRPLKLPRKNAFAYGDITQIEPFLVDKAQWLYSHFDFNEGARNIISAIDYFCERFIMWQRYQVAEADKGELAKYKQSDQEMLEDIDRAILCLNLRIDSLKQLKAHLGSSRVQKKFPSLLENRLSKAMFRRRSSA